VALLLKEIKLYSLDIQWDEIIQMQILCLSKGTNGVGIPDLIIAQNAIQSKCKLLSNDKHFTNMSKYFPLELFA
jgi:predicted nucleic acid-binding protein